MAKKKKKPDFSKPKPVKTPEQDVEIVSAFEKSPDTDSENSDAELSQIVKDTPGHTYADDREFVCLFQEKHDDKTDAASCKRIECCEQAAEKKSDKRHADQVCGERVPLIHAVHQDQWDKIRESELNARYACIKGEKNFHI